MQYRKFGKLGFDVSAFGLGCMRLPLKLLADGKTEYGQIDEEKAIAMIRYAIDHGVNYVDTAYTYHEENSERVVGKALKDGYRGRTMLATKLPVWKAEKTEDFERMLDEQLDKLQTDHIDFYLLHTLNREIWSKAKTMGVLDFLDRVKASGKIKYACFSFHDQLDVFKEIINSYDKWDMCQVQFNILDEHKQAGIEGIEYAASRGIPVVIMEPLRGGSLANVSNDIKAIWDKAGMERSHIEWAFRWICNHPEVTVVLSGVSTMEQLKDNIRIFENALPNSMSEQELAIVNEVQKCYKSRIKVGCTGCRYCMPCPSGVDIPDIFGRYDDAMLFDTLEDHRVKYKRSIIGKGKDPSQCAECGHCESVCPQHISIIEKLKEAHDVLGS